MEDHDWRLKAECLDADPDAFFPEAGSNGIAAKVICARCDVREECLDYAMTHWIDDGIWGGTSVVERERLRGWVRKKAA
jgi:WhiB family redox-sensing transcriptional regulator